MKQFNNDTKDRIIIIDKLEEDWEYKVSDNEKKTFVILLIDGKDQSGDVNININGSNAKVEIIGCILGYGNRKIEINSMQYHESPGSTSDLLIKSVLFDKTKLYYKGLIKITENAQKSNAYQKNQNLLLSKSAWADSRPYLEILANDVRCTHGATVGNIDVDQLYYLQTRGLSRETATQLIVEGFCQEVFNRIPDDKIRDNIKEKVDKIIQKLLSKSK